MSTADTLTRPMRGSPNSPSRMVSTSSRMASRERSTTLLATRFHIFGGKTVQNSRKAGLRSQALSQVSGLRSQVSGLRLSGLRSQVSGLRSQVSGSGLRETTLIDSTLALEILRNPVISAPTIVGDSVAARSRILQQAVEVARGDGDYADRCLIHRTYGIRQRSA